MVLTDDAAKTSSTLSPPIRPPTATLPTRRRWPRIAIFTSLALVMLCILGVGGTGWYFSSQALALAPDDLTYSQRVLALTRDTITITRTDDTMRPGMYRLQWRGGQVLLGSIVSINAGAVSRHFTGSTAGLSVGTPVHFDGYIYTSPTELGLPYQNVKVPDPLGPMPAWFIPGASKTWVIIMHGRGMSRMEGLRPLPTLAGLGLPVLDMSYRNDKGSPSSSDRSYHFGATEWQDLEAGVRYALAHGAHNVVLYGYSFGGGIAESFLHRSAYSGRVRAVVLDSPMLDMSAIFSFRAPGYLPGPMVAVAKQVIVWRLGLSNLAEVNKLLPAVNYEVPTLFFQGTGDVSIPPDRNLELARLRPGQVTLVRFPGAQHTQEWNDNPHRYATALKRFLRRVLR